MARSLLPSGILPRAAATGRIVAQLGKAAAKRVVRRSEDDDHQLGEALFSELDQLKGVAMKVGQILSYMDVGLPDGTVDRLTKLQHGAEPLDLAVVRAALEAALGAPLDQLFERFDAEPVAAASIGQVHRARHAGAEVAVKVRYPSVRETLDGDFRQLGALGRLASLGSQVDGPALVAELHARMLEECDYAREAAWQQAFAQAFATDPEVSVPAVHLDRSAEGVLTTSWHEGERFAALFDAPAARRLAVARTLMRFSFTSLLRHGVLQADPHPGNFLFPGDGQVVALDYGCVRRFGPDTVAQFRHLSQVVLDGDRAAFPEAIRSTGQVGREDRYDDEEAWELHRWLYAPYLEPRFRFERRWWLRGLKFSQPTAKNARAMNLPPAWLWLVRMQWGLHAVLVRLHAEGDFRDSLRARLADPLVPMLGPSSAVDAGGDAWQTAPGSR